ncbi:MAG: arylsulfatase [Planctomycetes bacterium]|nr:arylsulfatase [Planctomycetota bacterium]
MCRTPLLLLLAAGVNTVVGRAQEPAPPPPPLPNILLIYADDLGYGELGCQGATRVPTPNLDRLAASGLRFTDAHSTAATCTPSRYSLLTGQYAFRRQGTGVLPGDANLVIEPGATTLPALLQRAGYRTAVIGKWHLGLGRGDLDWNGAIAPGPLEVGFDECFLLPATGDRVPCVYVENHRVAGLDPGDPLRVSYRQRLDDAPLGRERPDLLKMPWFDGHDMTIVNGISRIGYMSGGTAARWIDEQMADTFVARAIDFLERNQDRRFGLYFATHDIHVPRAPHPRFVGKTAMGPRGDAIVQLDWTVGRLLDSLDRLHLTDHTLVLFTSDNGPVVNDGYADGAVEHLGDHRPAGPLRGGKYSAFEAGTRVPLLVRWPGRVRPGVSPALVSQVDLLASLAALVGQPLDDDDAVDSLDQLAALLGADRVGRDHVIEQASTLALRVGPWKFVAPGQGPAYAAKVGIELGNARAPQLYDLRLDLGEHDDLAFREPERTAALAARLQALREAGRTRPRASR